MTRADWPEVAVADLQARERWSLNGGPFGSKLVSRDYVDAGVPVIRGTNLPDDRRFSYEGFVFVSEAKADDLLANNAHPGDVVFTQRGTLGQVGIIPNDSPYPRFVISQSQMKMTVDDSRVDAKWLFYCFRNPSTQQEMINRASSSGVPHINLGVLREFRIRLPSLPEQRRIASILSAYDDLIENNSRRIAILEEMARRIYEEWFVRFRFPGHEDVRMVESELGLVPEGWARETLADCASVTMGQSPSSEFYNDKGEGLPFHQGVTNFGRHFPTHKMFCSSEGRLAEEGDILVSVRAPVGRINLSPSRLVIGRGLCAVRSRTGQQTFLLHRLFETFKEEDSMGNGAIFKAVSKQEVLGLPFLVPHAPLVAAFEEMATPFWSLIRNLTDKNINLRTTRDLLLPKLISGELSVENIEIAREAP